MKIKSIILSLALMCNAAAQDLSDSETSYTGATILEGDIEVNIETMELRDLMELQTIGIDACADILDLVTVLNAYESGKKVGVVDESE